MSHQLLPLTAEGHHLHFSAQKDDFKQPMYPISKVIIDPRMLTKAGRNQQPLLLQESRNSKFKPQQPISSLAEQFYYQGQAPQPKTKKKESEKQVESSPSEDFSHSTHQTGSKGSAHRPAFSSQSKYIINDNGQFERLIRKRKRKSGEQLKTLMREFDKNPNWSKETLLEISKKSGLSEAQVYKWGWD
jgi:hypothetical protein